MKYLVKRRIMWATKTEDTKRRAGKPFKERTAKVGKTLDEKQLDGADVEGLVAKGALEPIEEDGDE